MHTHDPKRPFACQGRLADGRCITVKERKIGGFDAPVVREIHGPAWELKFTDRFYNMVVTGRIVLTDDG